MVKYCELPAPPVSHSEDGMIFRSYGLCVHARAWVLVCMCMYVSVSLPARKQRFDVGIVSDMYAGTGALL